MRAFSSKMITIISILIIGFMAITPFISHIQAHPKKLIQWAAYDVEMCEGTSIVVDMTLVWGMSEVVAQHNEDHAPDNPNHDVQILYHDTYYVTYVYRAEA